MYADDLVFYCRSSNLSHLYESLNSALSTISNNLSYLDLEISTAKTQFCVFSQVKFVYFSRLLREQQLSLSLNGQEIPFCPTVKFLGVHFDSNLNWRRYVSVLRTSVKLRVNVIRAIAGISWGVHPRTLLMAL